MSSPESSNVLPSVSGTADCGSDSKRQQSGSVGGVKPILLAVCGVLIVACALCGGIFFSSTTPQTYPSQSETVSPSETPNNASEIWPEGEMEKNACNEVSEMEKNASETPNNASEIWPEGEMEKNACNEVSEMEKHACHEVSEMEKNACNEVSASRTVDEEFSLMMGSVSEHYEVDIESFLGMPGLNQADALEQDVIFKQKLKKIFFFPCCMFGVLLLLSLGALLGHDQHGDSCLPCSSPLGVVFVIRKFCSSAGLMECIEQAHARFLQFLENHASTSDAYFKKHGPKDFCHTLAVCFSKVLCSHCCKGCYVLVSLIILIKMGLHRRSQMLMRNYRVEEFIVNKMDNVDESWQPRHALRNLNVFEKDSFDSMHKLKDKLKDSNIEITARHPDIDFADLERAIESIKQTLDKWVLSVIKNKNRNIPLNLNILISGKHILISGWGRSCLARSCINYVSKKLKDSQIVEITKTDLEARTPEEITMSKIRGIFSATGPPEHITNGKKLEDALKLQEDYSKRGFSATLIRHADVLVDTDECRLNQKAHDVLKNFLCEPSQGVRLNVVVCDDVRKLDATLMEKFDWKFVIDFSLAEKQKIYDEYKQKTKKDPLSSKKEWSDAFDRLANKIRLQGVAPCPLANQIYIETKTKNDPQYVPRKDPLLKPSIDFLGIVMGECRELIQSAKKLIQK